MKNTHNSPSVSEKPPKVYIRNKKGLHDYYIEESFEVGVKLSGMEVKSIRAGRVDLAESFARIINGQLYLLNAHIPAYQTPPEGYQPARTRTLLMHKKQIQSLIGKLPQSNYTLIPVSLYETRNLIKIQLGLGKSKNKIDKRKIIKDRDHKRRVEQELRGKE